MAALLAAAEKTANALENWMEIADEEDQRDSDYEALAEVRLAIEAAKAGT
jgi:ribosome maturation protein Sdo1